MRLVRLKLRTEHFWNLPPIRLNENNDTSPQINIDLLNEHQKSVINKSIKAREIYAIDSSGSHLSSLECANIITGDFINTDDVDDIDDELMPQIVSVTSSDNDEYNEYEDGGELDGEEEVKADEERKRLLIEEAKILLNRNGNTLRKTILALEKTDDNLALLHACLSIEEQDKKRSGVIAVLGQAISRY